MIKFISTIAIPLTLRLHIPMMILSYPLYWQSRTPHMHWEIAISISILPPTPKQNREKTWKLIIKVLFNIPLPPELLPLFPQSLLHNNLARQSPTPHIHWEITIFMPPPPKKNRKSQKSKLMIKLLLYILLSPMLHLPPPMMLPPNTLSQQSPTPHLRWKFSINISKLPQAPKKPGTIDWCPRHWWSSCFWQWFYWYHQWYWQLLWINRLQQFPYSLIKRN